MPAFNDEMMAGRAHDIYNRQSSMAANAKAYLDLHQVLSKMMDLADVMIDARVFHREEPPHPGFIKAIHGKPMALFQALLTEAQEIGIQDHFPNGSAEIEAALKLNKLAPRDDYMHTLVGGSDLLENLERVKDSLIVYYATAEPPHSADDPNEVNRLLEVVVSVRNTLYRMSVELEGRISKAIRGICCRPEIALPCAAIRARVPEVLGPIDVRQGARENVPPCAPAQKAPVMFAGGTHAGCNCKICEDAKEARRRREGSP
jgi:hypothetical protein